MHIDEDGRCFPVNCESNRRLAALRFLEEGDPEMTAGMCGFMFLFGALKPDSEDAEKAERVAIKIYGDFKRAKTSVFCRASAMRMKVEQPLLFEVLAFQEPEAFVSHEWPVENLDK